MTVDLVPKSVRKRGLRQGGVHKQSRPESPLVSIVTATFNDAAALLSTAESIRQLNYKNVEWIVIDGGSSDGTLDSIHQSESVIDYWISEPDRGIYDAWNKGVGYARGDWISFLGAGDRYHPAALDLYVEAINAHPSVPHLVSSRVRHVNAAGKVLRIWGSRFSWEGFRKHMVIGHCGALHHRILFEKHGLFDTTFSCASDYEFLMRCGPGLDSVYVDAVTTDMPVGGVSNGYEGLIEMYRIQRKYGAGAIATARLAIGCAKRFFRPLLRGY